MSYCTNCGNALPTGANVCPTCGTPKTTGHSVQYVQYVKPKVPGKGFGITSMVLGIVGMFYSVYLFFAIMVLMNTLQYVGSRYYASMFSATFTVMLMIFSSLSIMALAFGCASRKRGYINGISSSGVIMGTIGLILFIIAIIAAISIG